ncbi:MAG: hypothetical protein WBA13_15215 [Microcoleaceae cyanobacterium]
MAQPLLTVEGSTTVRAYRLVIARLMVIPPTRAGASITITMQQPRSATVRLAVTRRLKRAGVSTTME